MLHADEKKFRLRTPDYRHVTGLVSSAASGDAKSIAINTVYEPAEDTFLLLDALERDWEHIVQHVKPTVVFEAGCGSGLVSTCLAQHLSWPAFFIGGDINSAACRCTQQTFAVNECDKKPFDVINCDLLSALRSVSSTDCSSAARNPKLTIDLMLFNPPYVPTNDVDDSEFRSEVANDTQDRPADATFRAWAGGSGGRDVSIRFLRQALPRLAVNGTIYLLILKENFPGDFTIQRPDVMLSDHMKKNAAFSVADALQSLAEDAKEVSHHFHDIDVETIIQEKRRNEYLAVVRLHKKPFTVKKIMVYTTKR